AQAEPVDERPRGTPDDVGTTLLLELQADAAHELVRRRGHRHDGLLEPAAAPLDDEAHTLACLAARELADEIHRARDFLTLRLQDDVALGKIARDRWATRVDVRDLGSAVDVLDPEPGPDLREALGGRQHVLEHLAHLVHRDRETDVLRAL